MGAQVSNEWARHSGRTQAQGPAPPSRKVACDYRAGWSTAIDACCGSDQHANRPTFGMSVGGTMTLAPRRDARSHSKSSFSMATYGSQNEYGPPGGDFISPPAATGSPLGVLTPGRCKSVYVMPPPISTACGTQSNTFA